MRRHPFLPLAAVCVLTASSVVAQSPSLTPFRGLIDHVSVDQWGGAYQNVEIWHNAISGDGRYVVMSSQNSYLATDDYDDWNGLDDIFLRDRVTGTTTRISRPYADGAGDGISQMGTISTNGRHVAFASGSTNLVAGDTNNRWDVFVRDLDQQSTVRVSVATDGTQGDRDAYYPSLSADGRFVAFVSWATTFAPGVSSSAPRQMYLHDRDADADGIFDEPGGVTTELISVGLTGGIADESVDSPRVSSDGHVLFESAATNLSDVGNPNASNHLYLRDRLTGQTAFIDRAMTGGPSSWGVGYGTSDMTDDGRFITFSSISPDIVWFDMNWQSQVFRYDTVAGQAATTIVSRLPDGTVGDGSSYASSVSADGRYVVFTTAASNLASPPPGASGPAMLAVRDMLDGSFARVDVLDSGEPFDLTDYYYTAAVSADGTAIVLQTQSGNAVEGPSGISHVVVVTAFSAEPAPASYSAAGGSGSIEVNTTAVSGWNAWSPWPWIMLTEGGGFGAGPRTVQYVVDSNSSVLARDGWIRVGSKYILIHQDGDGNNGDTTPPILTPTVTGTQVNGWYTSDITVTWSVTDPDSEIVSQTGCAAQTFTLDFIGSSWCEATSHGGTSFVSVPLRRDTTPPVVTIGTPTQTIYSAGAVVTPWYNCSDASGFSGVTTCALTQGSSPLNTTPGRHIFTVTSTDAVGNAASKSVEYMVGTGACVMPSVSPTDYLKVWLPLNGGTDPWRDRASGGFFGPMLAQGGFSTAVVGQGWGNGTAGNYLIGGYPASNYTIDTVQAGEGLTIAAWVKPEFTSTGTILSNPLQYRVARFPDGTLRWAFNQQSIGFTWRNTGVVVPNNAWSHVAVTYKNGNVRTYLNGRLVSNLWVFGYLQTTGDPNGGLTVAGRAGVSESLLGVIDDVMLFKEALSDADIESIALAGSGSVCVPHTSAITLTAPSTVAYGATFPVTALLTDGSGTPLPDREIEIGSRVGPAGYLYQFNTRTGANGTATVQLPVSASATLGSYANAIKAYFPGDVSHQSSQIVQGATLVAGTPTVSWPSPAAIVYGTALGAGHLNATASIAGTFAYSPAAGTILDAGTQTLSLTFTPDDTSHWGPTTRTATLVVNKATPTVTATGGTFTYDNQPHAGSGTATGVFGESLTPVTLTYDGSSSTPPTAGGAHTVRASFAGSANYLAAQSADAVLTINRATPTVEFSAAPVWYTGYARTATVFVRGIGGGELHPYTLLYNGSTTAPVDAGTYTLEVQFAGNSNYEPVTATSAFVVNKATPIIGTLNDIIETYDVLPHGVNVNIAGVAGEWLTPVIMTYNGSTELPVNAGVYAAEVRYDGSANYTAISRTYTLTILKAAPSLTWANPAGITYGAPLGASQLNAASNVAGSFEYSPAAGTVLNAGTHTLATSFTPSDTTNYQTGSLSRSITVSKAAAQAIWYRPDDVVYGTPLGPTQLNATAPTSGTFTYSPAAGTVPGAGDHVLSVTFAPDDAANWNESSALVPFTVVKASSIVSWNNPEEIVYGTVLGTSQLNATANAAGTFSYSPAVGAVLSAGSHTLSVTFTPDDAANYNSASANVSLTVTKAATTISWANPADIVYGAALGASQLNATASVAGTFSYSPAAGTVLNAGAHTLSVTFTPDDATNYNGASSTVSLTVNKSDSVVSWNNPANIVYGTALGVSQLNATANVAGSFSYSPAAGTVLGAGSYTLVVTFTPADAGNYNGSSASRSLTVIRAPLTITANGATKVYGAPLPAFSASGSGFVNGDSMASLTGTLGFTTTATSSSAVGGYPITPNGVSSANYTIAFANGTLTVVRASTATAVAASPNPDGLNQAVTFTAVISVVAPGAGAPTGIVQFFDGTTLLGSATVVSGSASLTTNGLTAGSHSISATYAGDVSFAPSSGSNSLTVKTAAQSSTTAVTSSANPSNLGQNVTLTATVTAPAGLSGSVAFYDGSALLATRTLSGTTATFTTNALANGGHAITARYLGNATIPPSTSTALAQYVKQSGSTTRTSTTTVTASPSPATLGGNVTLTATVTGSNNRIPTGQVLFMVNGTVIGQATVSPIGGLQARATFSVSSLAHGTHKVQAVYLGDTVVRASAATQISLVVN